MIERRNNLRLLDTLSAVKEPPNVPINGDLIDRLVKNIKERAEQCTNKTRNEQTQQMPQTSHIKLAKTERNRTQPFEILAIDPSKESGKNIHSRLAKTRQSRTLEKHELYEKDWSKFARESLTDAKSHR